MGNAKDDTLGNVKDDTLGNVKDLDGFQLGYFIGMGHDFFGVPTLIEIGFSITDEIVYSQILLGVNWRFIEKQKFSLSLSPKIGASTAFIRLVSEGYEKDDNTMPDQTCLSLEADLGGVYMPINRFGLGVELGYNQCIPMGTSTMFDDLKLEVNNSGLRGSAFLVFNF